VSAALFVFYASLTYWDADRSYGPRYLLPMLPLVCVPLVFWFGMARGLARAALLTVVAASVIGQLPGVLVDFTKVGAVLDLRRIEIEQRRWNWELAGLVLNTRAALAAVPLNVRYVTGAAEPPATRPPDGRAPEYSEQFGYSLDFWWLYLYYMRVLTAPLALGAGAVLLGASVWMLVLLGRTPRQA
jgi:hypothetical protein